MPTGVVYFTAILTLGILKINNNMIVSINIILFTKLIKKIL